MDEVRLNEAKPSPVSATSLFPQYFNSKKNFAKFHFLLSQLFASPDCRYIFGRMPIKANLCESQISLA